MILGLCDVNTISLDNIKTMVYAEIRRLIEEIEHKTDKYMRYAENR